MQTKAEDIISFEMNDDDIKYLSRVVARMEVNAGMNIAQPGVFTIRNHSFDADKPGAFIIRNHNFSTEKAGAYTIRNYRFQVSAQS